MKKRLPDAVRLERSWEEYIGSMKVAIVLLTNAIACWLIAEMIGGSALLSETAFEGPPFIEIAGERVTVPWWLHEFSFWHGVSVFFTVPVIGLMLVFAAFERFRFARLQRRLDRRSLQPEVMSA